MQKNKKGATTKISLYHTWFSTFAKIILQINLVAKTVKAHVCSATNSEPLSRKLKLSQISITTVAGNTSTAFLASLFKAVYPFFRKISSFVGDSPEAAGSPSPVCIPAIANAIIYMVTERVLSIDAIEIFCS